VLPLTSLRLKHQASSERVTSGLDELDAMLGGRGFYRGSSALISGYAGTGKTTLAGHFANASCRSGGRCLYMLFEESPQQMIRNMRSAGIDLEPWVKSGLLQFHADRPSRHGLETHLVVAHRLVEQFKPDVVVIDPMTSLLTVGTQLDVRAMMTRLIDFLKMDGATVLFTSLTHGGDDLETTDALVSSLMDTWVLLTTEEKERRRHRWLYVLKSRGMSHSNEVREFRLTDHGVDILPSQPVAARGEP
jgi:circadian clock protein KaiC